MREKKSVFIRVPASAANIGPGFDSFGIALSLYNRYEVIFQEEGDREISWIGEPLVPNKENLVAITLDEELRLRGRDDIGYHLIMHEQQIPVSRGLGSSSAAIIGGILASFWLCDIQPDRKYLIDRAAQLEGHPDNSTAAISGDFCISKIVEKSVIYRKLNFFEDVVILLMIPEQKMSTENARAALPQSYGLSDIVHAISSSSLLICSLCQKDKEIFSASLQDTIHVPYRLPLIRDGKKVIEFVNNLKINCLGITISGSGSALIGFFADIRSNEKWTFLVKELSKQFEQWNFVQLKVDTQGAIYE